MQVSGPAFCGLFFLAPLAIHAADAPRNSGAPIEIRFRQGDDPRWAAPDWDDSDWQRAVPGQWFLPVRAGIHWVRIRLERTDEPAERPVLRRYFWPRDEPGSPIDSVFIATPLSFDFYWDGRLLRRSGVVGADAASEVPGTIDNLIPIPPGLMGPGEHVVAIRVSSWHFGFRSPRAGIHLAMENFADRLAFEARSPLMSLVGSGMAVMAALFCAVLFCFVGRRRLLLICFGLCVSAAVLYFLIAWRWLHNETHDMFAARLLAISIVVTLICGLQAWLVLDQFNIPRKRWWLLALAPLVVAAWMSSAYHPAIVHRLYVVMMIFCIAAAGRAVWLRCVGARWALAGALLGLSLVQFNWESRRVIIPPCLPLFGAQGACLLISIGLGLRDDRRRVHEAMQTASRLEAELLRKNLQPHFLLNTLTALTEVIERRPGVAVEMIEDLSGVLRSLARMAGEKRVTLGEEIALCRAHLRVIGVRTGVPWTLDAGSVEEDFLVPPAVFLTLIENGLVHQEPAPDSSPVFRLRMTKSIERVRFEFLSPGEVRERADRGAGGSGLRYVKARLEESFPGRWVFDQRAVPGGWETAVEIPGPA